VAKKSSSKAGTATRFRVYVKRGAGARRFEQLERESADLPVVVQWDRRLADRRQPTEAPGAELVGLTPRTGERRKAPSSGSEQADFIVVEVPDDEQD
jgi:hypothetical protein